MWRVVLEYRHGAHVRWMYLEPGSNEPWLCSFCEHSVDLPHNSVRPGTAAAIMHSVPSNRKARREYGFSFKLPRLYLANTLLTRKTNGWAIGFLRWTRELVKHIKDNSKALVILMF